MSKKPRITNMQRRPPTAAPSAANPTIIIPRGLVTNETHQAAIQETGHIARMAERAFITSLANINQLIFGIALVMRAGPHHPDKLQIIGTLLPKLAAARTEHYVILNNQRQLNAGNVSISRTFPIEALVAYMSGVTDFMNRAMAYLEAAATPEDGQRQAAHNALQDYIQEHYPAIETLYEGLTHNEPSGRPKGTMKAEDEYLADRALYLHGRGFSYTEMVTGGLQHDFVRNDAPNPHLAELALARLNKELGPKTQAGHHTAAGIRKAVKFVNKKANALTRNREGRNGPKIPQY